MKIKKGNIVGRISYGKDVFFIVDKIIINSKNKEFAILKGINIRIMADSPIEDLEIISKEDVLNSIKIANIDLYKSKGTLFGVEDDKTIIPPFSSIDGLGDVVAKNIEAEAQKNPFISIEDFQSRCKVSSTLIEKMKTMGLFENMQETSQLSIF